MSRLIFTVHRVVVLPASFVVKSLKSNSDFRSWGKLFHNCNTLTENYCCPKWLCTFWLCRSHWPQLFFSHLQYNINRQISSGARQSIHLNIAFTKENVRKLSKLSKLYFWTIWQWCLFTGFSSNTKVLLRLKV